ncbi:MAG TPA: FkbM family methyltransferase [Nitrospirae bacterium]|mgnify:CR=1 FL=1|nr:FkbM family methyltransferase [Nitrospirota bacterium]
MNDAIHKLLKLYNILREPLFARALLKGTAAGTEHRRFLQNLNCGHVVDIGANCGQFAVISRRCFPNARIDSFEPLSEPAARFERVFAADANTHLHRCAIGSEKTTMTIHVSERDDSSSLLPIGQNQTDLFPHTGEREVRETPVLPLHEVIDAEEICSPALLKIDVQGFELEVLKGCRSMLDHFSYIYIECSFIELYKGQALAYEVIDFLHKHGFFLSNVYHMSYDHEGRAIQADFVFERRKTDMDDS